MRIGRRLALSACSAFNSCLNALNVPSSINGSAGIEGVVQPDEHVSAAVDDEVGEEAAEVDASV